MLCFGYIKGFRKYALVKGKAMSVVKNFVVIMAFLCVGIVSARVPGSNVDLVKSSFEYWQGNLARLDNCYFNLTTLEGRKFCTIFLGLDLLTARAIFKWQHAAQKRGSQIPPVPAVIQVIWLQMILRYFRIAVNTSNSIGTFARTWWKNNRNACEQGKANGCYISAN